MIDWLKTGKAANFHRKHKRLTIAAITDLFRKIRRSHVDPSKNIFYHVREPLGSAHWSAIAFFHDAEPAFLELPPAYTRERACGFVMIVEHRNHIAILKAGLEIPATFKTEYLDRIAADSVERAIGRTDAVFQQIRLRNMTTAKQALRSKTLEAGDLQNVVGPAGASRFVPQGYRVQQGETQYSATPSTGRISQRADQAGYEELVQWSCAVIDQLLDTSLATSPFIRGFARSIDLNSIPPGTTETVFAPSAADLAEELFETPDRKRLVRKIGENFEVVTHDEARAVLTALDQAFPLTVNRNGIFITDPRSNVRVGTLSINKSRIALRTFGLPEIEDLYIEPDAGPPGQTGDCIKLKRYIDHENAFTVLFSDTSLAYIDGTLYRDEQFSDGGRTFLKYIRTDAGLGTVTGEKGAFTAAQQSFSPDSVFRCITDNISVGDNILVCDDLGDEWADFIGIDSNSSPKAITFYHGKHHALSLGASPLHDAVGQAIKNLGRMWLQESAMPPKIAKWNLNYNNGGAQTQIRRLVRGQAATLEAGIEDARSAPDVIRRVVIVTSSLSKQQLEQTLAAISAGTAPSPHFVQLYWLLMSFFSACNEANAFGCVVCLP